MKNISISKKIYVIVGMLLIIAMIILSVGVYGTNNLSSTMQDLVRQARRVIIVGDAESIALQRRITTESAIKTVEEDEIKKLIDNDMLALEVQMEAVLKTYVENFDSPPTAVQLENEQNTRKLWNDYVAITNQVAALSFENTNNKAFRINNEMRDYWSSLDRDLCEIAAVLMSRDDMQDQSLQLLTEIRLDIMKYRTLVLRFIPELDIKVTEALQQEILEIIYSINQNIASLAGSLSPKHGGDAAKKLEMTFVNYAKPRIDSIIDLVQKDTDVFSFLPKKKI